MGCTEGKHRAVEAIIVTYQEFSQRSLTYNFIFLKMLNNLLFTNELLKERNGFVAFIVQYKIYIGSCK